MGTKHLLSSYPEVLGTCWGPPGADATKRLRADIGRLALPVGRAVAPRRTAALEGLTRDVATRSLARPWEGYDTTLTDLATMHARLGPLLASLGIELPDRRDIDRAAAVVLERWGL